MARLSRRDRAVTRLAADLHALTVHLSRTLRHAEAATRATGPRLAALSVLAEHTELTMGELAAAERVSAPTMTRLVRALECAGLAERVRVAGDRRSVRVRATRRGRALLRAAHSRRVRELSRLLEDLAPDEVVALERAATVLKELLG